MSVSQWIELDYRVYVPRIDDQDKLLGMLEKAKQVMTDKKYYAAINAVDALMEEIRKEGTGWLIYDEDTMELQLYDSAVEGPEIDYYCISPGYKGGEWDPPEPAEYELSGDSFLLEEDEVTDQIRSSFEEAGFKVDDIDSDSDFPSEDELLEMWLDNYDPRGEEDDRKYDEWRDAQLEAEWESREW